MPSFIEGGAHFFVLSWHGMPHISKTPGFFHDFAEVLDYKECLIHY